MLYNFFKNYKLYIYLTFLYWVSRLILFKVGIGFDYAFYDNYSHSIGREVMQNHLWESIFYLHTQPPLFNLWAGLILNWFPDHYVRVLHLSFMMMGWGFGLALLNIMLRLHIQRVLAFLLTSIVLISPSIIIYEKWFMVDFPTLFFLTIGMYFLAKFLEKNTYQTAFAFFACLTFIVFLRYVFHWIWLVALSVGLLLFLNKKYHKKLIVSGLVAVLLSGSWLMKNYLFFGDFMGTGIQGINYATIYFPYFDQSTKDSLFEAGQISALYKIRSRSTLNTFSDYYTPNDEAHFAGVEILHYQKGLHHWDNINYIPIAQQYKKDVEVLLHHKPEMRYQHIGDAFYYFFVPTTDNKIFYYRHDRDKIGWYDELYNFLLGCISYDYSFEVVGRPRIHQPDKWLSFSWIYAVFFAGVVCYGVFFFFKKIKMLWQNTPPKLALLGFALFNIAYVFLISILFELGENSRQRFYLIPFMVIFLALTIREIKQSFQQKPE